MIDDTKINISLLRKNPNVEWFEQNYDKLYQMHQKRLKEKERIQRIFKEEKIHSPDCKRPQKGVIKALRFARRGTTLTKRRMMKWD